MSDVTLDALIRGFRAHRDNAAKGLAPDAEAELDHLRLALQAAVTLEFATLPPYLSALWSVKDDTCYVAKSIRQVVQEEMLHMALACNMLVSIGGHPQIATAVPSYPGHLPLGIHPELIVPLGGLSTATLEGFLEIERPAHPGHHISLNAANELGHLHDVEDPNPGPEDFTIGEFYEHIVESFRRLNPPQSTDRQVTAPLASMVVKNADDVATAVGIITRQGEGSGGPADTGPYNLAHYYRFAEIIELKQLVQDPATGDYTFDTPIAFDMTNDVWPMALVPDGGYAAERAAAGEVARLLDGFTETYGKLLDLLQGVWESDEGQAALWHGIDTMFELERTAKPLMQIARPDGQGNYGPDFRYGADR